MAVKVPVQWYGRYLGEMTEQQAQWIMNLRNEKVIPNLKNMLFDFPPELVLRSIEEKRSIRSIIKSENIDVTPYQSELRDYQTVGTGFMYLSPRSILADGCGLGKTAEVSGLINYLKSKGELTRFLMAVDNSALGQIQSELMRFTGLRVVALPSETAKLKKVIQEVDWRTVDGIVIKHSMLRNDTFSKWLAINIDPNTNMCTLFNTFFLDESSVIKNANTKLYEYTKNICDICGRVHFLNATTFETCIMDIYNQVDMMNETLLPKPWRIEKDFCTFTRTSYWTKRDGKAQMNFRRERSGYKNQAAFKQSLELIYFGRSASEIGKELPHIYKVYEVDPTNDMCCAISKGYRYNEILNCPSLVPEAKIEMNRKNVPKLDRLCELVENEFTDRKIMVYCFHIEAQKAIANELEAIGRKPIILNGSCTDDERYEYQKGFNNGTYDVIITNIKKSLNLQGGDVCIFYSLETNIAKMEQIRGRIDRHTDDEVKTFIMLLYRNTAEYKFFSDVVCKRAKDSRDLTIDAKMAADFFFDALSQQESDEIANSNS